MKHGLLRFMREFMKILKIIMTKIKENFEEIRRKFRKNVEKILKEVRNFNKEINFVRPPRLKKKKCSWNFMNTETILGKR